MTATVASMKLAEAREILAGRLVFGEPRHIEAVELTERSRRFQRHPACQVDSKAMESWSIEDFKDAEEEYVWVMRGAGF